MLPRGCPDSTLLDPLVETFPLLCNFGIFSLYDASAGFEESQTIRLGGRPLVDLNIDKLLEDSPLFEWENLMMLSSAPTEDIDFAHNLALRHLLTYQVGKFHNFPLWSSPFTMNDTLAFLQPREMKLSVGGLVLGEVRIVWLVMHTENFAIHSFSDMEDPKNHLLELLCNALQGDPFPSQHEDPFLALSLTLIAACIIQS